MADNKPDSGVAAAAAPSSSASSSATTTTGSSTTTAATTATASNQTGGCWANVSVPDLKNHISNKLSSQKPLVIKAHSILIWDHEYYPIIIFGLVSLVFVIVQLLNSSLLTTLSYVGILAALFDLALPMIAKNLTHSGQNKQQNVDNQRFDKICLDLARVVAFNRNICNTMCSLKTKKPKLYYPVLLMSLILLAFIGSKFNNLFLTYLATLFVAMYPGLDRRGIPQKVLDVICQKLGKKAPQISGSFTNSSPPDSSRRSSSGKRN